MKSLLTGVSMVTLVAMGYAGCIPAQNGNHNASEIAANDSVRLVVDSVAADSGCVQTRSGRIINEADRYTKLTDEDFAIVADELGVEIAAIKAVVLIEAGVNMKGFWAPGVPVINFDRTVYNRVRSQAPNKAGAKGEKVPSGLTGYALREWTQLINARKVNAQGANMGTFWGMFQIGGFNYKKCGCETVDEMVKLMSESEFSQLEVFAHFIKNAGMLEDLKNKNWAQFARKYNGASYAKRGYHTRMAKAYAKFKNQN
ncbi:MAG: N-acetylmuramidase family protein [Muribaculaceae bacterium]|nr:N-acetylmuramidase family protein [Muribaculaceae bacterium]